LKGGSPQDGGFENHDTHVAKKKGKHVGEVKITAGLPTLHNTHKNVS